MLRLSLKLGEQLNIGDDIRIIYRHADASGIKIVLDAPKDVQIARAGTRPDKEIHKYYQDSWRMGDRLGEGRKNKKTED